MSDPSSGNGSAPQRRRMSIAEMFNSRPNLSSSPPNSGVPATPDTAHHRRGVSISTLGLAGSGGTQPSPYTAFARQRRASISTSSAASSPEFKNGFSDEHAVIEEDDPSFKSSHGSPPSPSFARRVSFGAQALRDVRQGGASAPNGGRSPSSLYTLSEDSNRAQHSSSRSFEAAQARGEGFNWSEALRDRTKRSPSFSTGGNPFVGGVNRTKSVGASAAPEPPREMPKSPPPSVRMKKPDHLGERMLRGDFMMD